jgi:pyridoxamine 5'-phosphate oxidase
MVLRAVDRAAGTVTFYTDARAPKVMVLTAAPRVAVTGYDAATRLQLRLHGTASVASTGVAVEAAWTALTSEGRTAYQSAAPPGTPLATPTTPPTISADRGRARFAVIAIVLDRFEWLDLAVPGHRRASHVRVDTVWRHSWLVP